PNRPFRGTPASPAASPIQVQRTAAAAAATAARNKQSRSNEAREDAALVKRRAAALRETPAPGARAAAAAAQAVQDEALNLPRTATQWRHALVLSELLAPPVALRRNDSFGGLNP
ncbi:MAG: hypothetical protein IOD15_06655, partial [Phycisphaerales bacterium]|nr:hypothetical protein [Phycisphaerales bacterium]